MGSQHGLGVDVRSNRPGNAREVENLLYRLVAFAGYRKVIGSESSLEETRVCAPPPAAAIIEDRVVIDARLSHHERLEELERLSLINAMNEMGVNITQAVAIL